MLSIIFFLVAAIYASVGFAGGTSYLALLTIYDVEYLLIPISAPIITQPQIANPIFSIEIIN